jgi:ribosomal protein S18 acetylase RimI-like enzyme
MKFIKLFESFGTIRIKLDSPISDHYYQFLYLRILKHTTTIGKFELELKFDKKTDDSYSIKTDDFDISIYGFEIEERYKGKGIGKYSFSKIIDYIEDKFNYRNIFLSVFKINKNAINIYEQYGFEIIKDDGEVLKMRKVRK